MTRRPRRLTPEERELWSRIAASATPLEGGAGASQSGAVQAEATTAPQPSAEASRAKPAAAKRVKLRRYPTGAPNPAPLADEGASDPTPRNNDAATAAATDEDRALWGLVAASTTPLSYGAGGKPRGKGAPAAPPKPGKLRRYPTGQEGTSRPAPVQPAHDLLPLPIAPFRIGATAGKSGGAASARMATPMADHLHDAPLRMDSHTHKRLKKGRLSPQARLDLHGMTLAQAQPELIGFVLAARANGLRLVLVITGKGRGGPSDPGPLPTRPGALRHSVPHWLHMAPLAAAVAQVVPAHDRHGGGGAFYVWLRR